MDTLQHDAYTPKPSRIMLGCMTFGKTWDGKTPMEELLPRGRGAVEAALESGINAFDHADIYCRGRSEEVFAAALADLKVDRSEIWVQGKLGIRFPGDPDDVNVHRFDFSYKHIIERVETCMRRLEVDYLDSLLLHRPDALVEPEEVARAFSELNGAGKVRHFGVSNHTAGQIELLQAYVDQPLRFNQIQLSLLHAGIISEGVDFNRDFSANPTRNHGTLDYCRLNNITIQPWSPLAKGKLSGNEADDDPEYVVETRKLVASVAEEHDVPPAAIVVAWLLRHPADFQPIIGTTDPQRIRDAAEGGDVYLNRNTWYKLWTAARGRKLP